MSVKVTSRLPKKESRIILTEVWKRPLASANPLSLDSLSRFIGRRGPG